MVILDVTADSQVGDGRTLDLHMGIAPGCERRLQPEVFVACIEPADEAAFAGHAQFLRREAL